MRSIIRSDIAITAGTVVVTLALIAHAAGQNRSLPPPPTILTFPQPSIAIPRPSPEIGAPPVLAVPEGEARQTERVCIEKEMCVDVPVSSKAPPGSSEPK